MSRLRRLDISLMVLAFGYAFLYVPILLVMVYSLNDSRLVSVWGGFSLRWYGELFRNDDVLAAAWLSLRVALLSATVATVLGTLAGLALARAGRFRGRVLFSGMIAAPLVMPAPLALTGAWCTSPRRQVNRAIQAATAMACRLTATARGALHSGLARRSSRIQSHARRRD